MQLAWMTSPDVADYIERDAVVIVPVGAIEQHGPHLPVSTDAAIVEAVAIAAAELSGDLVAPVVSYGYNQKELSFPGTVSATLETLTRYLFDVCNSLRITGFKRILILNGHGWNKPSIGAAAHLLAESDEVLCAATSYYDLIEDTLQEIRESEYPGGMSHGGELETSLALHLFPERVKMDAARKDISFPRSEYVWLDIQSPPPVSLPRQFKDLTKTGVIGDPTLATQEKGRLAFLAAAQAVANLSRDLRQHPLPGEAR